MNSTVGVILAVVLLLVLIFVIVNNNQRINSLKKSITAASVSSDQNFTSVSHGTLIRDVKGQLVPKQIYYMDFVFPPAGTNTSLPPPLTNGDRFIVQMNGLEHLDGRRLATDFVNNRLKVVYRPDRTTLYKVDSMHYMPDGQTTWQAVTTESLTADAQGQLLVNISKNHNSSDVITPLFTEAEKGSVGTGTNFRTLVGVPSHMSGNTVSGI